EGEEHARLASQVGAPVGDVVALEADAALRDLVLGAAEQGAGEGRLAGPVGAHEGVDLSGKDGQVNTLEDLHAVRADVQVLDLEEGGRRARHAPQCISTTAIVVKVSGSPDVTSGARWPPGQAALSAADCSEWLVSNSRLASPRERASCGSLDPPNSTRM